MDGSWLVGLTLALAAPPAPMVQDEHPPSSPMEKRAVVTIQDALKALDQTPQHPDPSRSLTPIPIGNPGQWFGGDAYPPAAMRAGAQGRVVATVAVDAGGRATGCVIAQSSTSSDLDAATCRIAVSRMSFTPAHTASGKAVAGDYRLAVLWRMPIDNRQIPAMTTTLVSVGVDGTVLSCTSPAPTALGDLCGAFPTGRKVAGSEAMRGKVFAVLTIIRPLEDR